MSASELLSRAGGPKYGDISPRELERWLTREGLAEVRDGQVRTTPKAVELVDMLWARVPRRRTATGDPDRLARRPQRAP